MNIRLLLLQFDIEEDYDTGNIVHNIFLFLLPFEIGFTDHSLSCLFRIFALKVRCYDLGNIFI